MGLGRQKSGVDGEDGNKGEGESVLSAEGEKKLAAAALADEGGAEAAETGREDGLTPPPDGGWGWVVVLASFLCNMILDGIAYSFGILLTSLMEHYGAGKGMISMVGSVLAGVIMLSGPIAAGLVNKYGTRIVCCAGAVTSAFAIFMSTFAPNVPTLMVIYGVVGGFGLGLMYVPAVVAVGYWFEKRRSLVTGISTCGSGVGTIVFAPLVSCLEAEFGWQGCNRILAGLCLSCVLFGLAMKPVPRKKRDEEDSITELKKNVNKPIYKDPTAGEEIAFIDGEREKVASLTSVKVEPKKKTGVLTLLRNPAFLLIMIANLPAVMGLYIPYMFLPAMSEERGLTKEQAALLISIIGAFNTAGRVISGAVTDHPKIDALLMTCFALFFGAMSPLFMDLCANFPGYIAVSIMFGFSLSAWPAVTSSMLVDLLGLESLTSAFGILTCIRGAAAFLGPPVGGFVIDASDGNYSLAFWISTILLGVASIIHFAAFGVKRKIQRS